MQSPACVRRLSLDLLLFSHGGVRLWLRLCLQVSLGFSRLLFSFCTPPSVFGVAYGMVFPSFRSASLAHLWLPCYLRSLIYAR